MDRIDSGSRASRRVLLGAAFACGLPLLGEAEATAHAREEPPIPTLLVRGEAILTAAATLAWRVVRDVAEPAPLAQFEQRALGFAVATSPFAPLLLTDQATGSAYRLAPGDASFVREGTFQRREALTDAAHSYLRIGLVTAAAADDGGGDRLIFSGSPFPAPAGIVTLSLHRVQPAPGDAVWLPRGKGDTLVLVEQGAVELEVGEAAPRDRLQTVVGSDAVYAIRTVPNAATLIGARDATLVLIARFD